MSRRSTGRSVAPARSTPHPREPSACAGSRRFDRSGQFQRRTGSPVARSAGTPPPLLLQLSSGTYERGSIALAERYLQHSFANGLTLLGEQMPGMQSAAMTLLVPAGSGTDPEDRSGSATVLAELVLRGAGERDNRQLTDYLDSLGLQRGSSVGVHHSRLSCAGVAPMVIQGLGAYADIVRRPKLPEEGFAPSRDLALQALAGIDDEPRQKLMVKLREWHLPFPYGRNSMGERAHLERLTLDLCREDFSRRYHAQGAILALAGNVDFEQITREVERLFGDWNGRPVDEVRLTPPPGRYFYEPQPSEQTHIGIAYPSIPETHDDYYV